MVVHEKRPARRGKKREKKRKEKNILRIFRGRKKGGVRPCYDLLALVVWGKRVPKTRGDFLFGVEKRGGEKGGSRLISPSEENWRPPNQKRVVPSTSVHFIAGRVRRGEGRGGGRGGLWREGGKERRNPPWGCDVGQKRVYWNAASPVTDRGGEKKKGGGGLLSILFPEKRKRRKERRGSCFCISSLLALAKKKGGGTPSVRH